MIQCLYLLWSVTGKTEQFVLLQAVTVGSSAMKERCLNLEHVGNIIRILRTLILIVTDLEYFLFFEYNVQKHLL